MESIPARELFFMTDTATYVDYLLWFKGVYKSYMLSPEERHRQIRLKRQRRFPQQRRRGHDRTMCSSSTSIKDAPPVATQYPGQFTPLIPIQFTNLVFFTSITALWSTTECD